MPHSSPTVGPWNNFKRVRLLNVEKHLALLCQLVSPLVLLTLFRVFRLPCTLHDFSLVELGMAQIWNWTDLD